MFGTWAAKIVVTSVAVADDPNADTIVAITGRVPGIGAWFLTLIGLSPRVSLNVTREHVEFSTTRLSGIDVRTIPLTDVEQTTFGYAKPLLRLVIGGVFAIATLVVMRSSVVVSLIPLLIAGAFLIAYSLGKTTLIAIHCGESPVGLMMRRSVIENVALDVDLARRIIGKIDDAVREATPWPAPPDADEELSAPEDDWVFESPFPEPTPRQAPTEPTRAPAPSFAPTTPTLAPAPSIASATPNVAPVLGIAAVVASPPVFAAASEAAAATATVTPPSAPAYTPTYAPPVSPTYTPIHTPVRVAASVPVNTPVPVPVNAPVPVPVKPPAPVTVEAATVPVARPLTPRAVPDVSPVAEPIVQRRSRSLMWIVIGVVTLAMFGGGGAVGWLYFHPSVTIRNNLAVPISMIVQTGQPTITIEAHGRISLRVPRRERLNAAWVALDSGSVRSGQMLVGATDSPFTSSLVRPTVVTVTPRVDGQVHFTPLITNDAGRPIRIVVNAGLRGRDGQSLTRECKCSIPPGAARVLIGYYPMYRNSTVTAIDESGASATYENLGPAIDQRSGAVVVRFRAQDLRVR